MKMPRRLPCHWRIWSSFSARTEIFIVGELGGDFADAARVGADGRVGEENVGGAAFASGEKFERGGAFEISDAARDQHF